MPTLKQKFALLKQNLRLGLKDRKTAVWAGILLALVVTVSTLAIVGNGNTVLFKGDIGGSQEITVAPLETYPSTTTAHLGDTNVDFGGFTLTAGPHFVVNELQLEINGNLTISNAKLIHKYPQSVCGTIAEEIKPIELTSPTILIDNLACRKHEFKIVADIAQNQSGGAVKVFKINSITTTPTSTFMPSLPFDLLKKIMTPPIVKATFIDIQSGGDDDITTAQFFSFFNNQKLNPGVTTTDSNHPLMLAFLSLKQEQALNPASIKKLSFANKSSPNIDFSKINLKVQAMTGGGGGEQRPTDAPFTPTHTGTSTDITFTTPLSLTTTGTTSIMVAISSLGSGFSPGDGNLIKLALENQTMDNCVGATPCELQVTPNNGGNGLDFGKITIDKTPPTISNIKAENTSRTSVTVFWDTNEPMQKGKINWGKKEVMGSDKETSDADWFSLLNNPTHSIYIDGLDANNSYNFKITAWDTAGNQATSAVGTFMSGLPDFEVTEVAANIPPSSNISAGDQVTFSAKVKNRSKVEAPASRGRFCVDFGNCLLEASSRINEPAISALTYNNTVTVNSSNWEAKPGNHSVIFCANPTAVEGYEVINEAPYDDPNGDEGRGPENCKTATINVKRAIRVEASLPEGQITNIPLDSTQDIKFASIKFSEINKDTNGTSTLKLKSFTLEYTGTFPFEKITSPAIARKDSGRAMAAAEVLVTKNNQLKNIIFDFKTPVAVGEAVEFITYAKANISQEEAGKKISYRMKYAVTDPADAAVIKPNLETNPVNTPEIFTAALQLEACKVGETRSTPTGPCACPANTYKYTGTASTPLFYQNPVGTVCVPCQQDQLTPVNGKLYCPADKPVAPPPAPPAPNPVRSTITCAPGYVLEGTNCRQLPPVQNAHSSATGTNTNVSVAQSAAATARATAAAAAAKAANEKAAADAKAKAAAAARAAATAAAARAEAAANSGAAGQQSRASAGTSGGTYLGGSQRIIRMPERGNTGPEALIYLGALPVLWGAWKLRKRLKK